MKYLVFALVLVLATSAFGLEKKAYQMREDFGMAPEYDGALQYYYYIPCPTYSWFWAYTGWLPGDIIGMGFHIGDQGTGGWDVLDPYLCQTLETIRVLDFAGYGTYYPGLFTIELCVWCVCQSMGGPWLNLWCSGPLETGFGWNYFDVIDPICLTDCWCYDCEPVGPTILVTAQMIGTNGIYPAWGMDNISTALEQACVMHDLGCMPVFWPRPPAIPGQCPCPNCHGGFFGNYFWEFLPPLGFLDGRDTTLDGTQYGYIELAWRIYVICGGATSTEPSTWSNIKSMYK
jgi:hypothetical protein